MKPDGWMCPVPLIHERHGQIIQVAATPLHRGDEEDEQWVRFGGRGSEEEDLKIKVMKGDGWWVAGCGPQHYCSRLSPGGSRSVSWPLRCLCSVLFLLSESARSPGSLSLSLSLLLSLRPSWFSLSLRLRFLRSLRSFFLRPGSWRKHEESPFPLSKVVCLCIDLSNFTHCCTCRTSQLWQVMPLSHFYTLASYYLIEIVQRWIINLLKSCWLDSYPDDTDWLLLRHSALRIRH